MQGNLTSDASRLAYALWADCNSHGRGSSHESPQRQCPAYSSVLLPPAAAIFSRAGPENA
ncbi:MAG: hypothetical protein QOG46_1009 [Pseudonocardiales bacterium]|nr:hypothetical protein [Pseudonocardiales bacterium]